MAEFPQIQAPSFKLSDENKEQLRKVDVARPYAHRAAMFGLPAMASANYMLPQMKRRGLAVGAIGAAGAGLGLMDRKIESIAEEHEELRPTLKNYSKNSPSSGAPMAAKTASVSDRVRRNQDELAAAFPMTMAQRVELQKEALMADPKTLGRLGGHAMEFMRGVKPTAIGAGVGAVTGAITNEDSLKGAVKGGLIGGAVGGAATGLTRAYTPELKAGLTSAWRGTEAARKNKQLTGVGDYLSNVRKGFRNYQPPAPPSAVATAEKTVTGSAPDSPLRVKLHHMTSKEGSAGSVSKVNEIINEVNGATPYIIGAGALGGGAYAGYLTHKQNKKNEKKGMQKRAGINTMHDAHRAIGGRPPYALLTMGGETSNDAVINQMLRALFANTDAMRKATEDQVLAAFPLSAPYSYGRHRAIGRTADDIKAEIALAYTPTQR